MNNPSLAARSLSMMIGVFALSLSLLSANPRDLIENSEFLSNGGISTLLPKRAVLHVPKNFQGRMKFQRGNNLVIWPKFYRDNRGWIKTIEVTREQAMGTEPLDEEFIKKIQKAGFVMVATFKGNPIQVLPNKDE